MILSSAETDSDPSPGGTLRPLLLVCLVVLLAGGPGSLRGQEDEKRPAPASAADTARRSSVLRQLRPGRRVRLERADRSRIAGSFSGRKAGQVLLRGPSGRHAIPELAIRRVWVRTRSPGWGAVGGAIPFGVAGGILGADLAEFACGDLEEDCGLEGALVGGTLGAASGAALGALVGLLIPRWEQALP